MSFAELRCLTSENKAPTARIVNRFSDNAANQLNHLLSVNAAD